MSDTTTHRTEKIAVRAAGMSAVFPSGLPDGWRIWMPCSGPGDMAAAMSDVWPPGRIDPVDEDASMCRRWTQRFGLDCPQGDALQYQFGDQVYGVADIDPFGGPAHMVGRFLAHARYGDPLLIVTTDGSGQFRQRKKRAWDFTEQKAGPVDSDRASEQSDNWPDELGAWMAEVTGRPVTTVEAVRRQHMWYCAHQIGTSGGPVRRPLGTVPDRPSLEEEYANLTAAEQITAEENVVEDVLMAAGQRQPTAAAIQKIIRQRLGADLHIRTVQRRVQAVTADIDRVTLDRNDPDQAHRYFQRMLRRQIDHARRDGQDIAVARLVDVAQREHWAWYDRIDRTGGMMPDTLLEAIDLQATTLAAARRAVEPPA